MFDRIIRTSVFRPLLAILAGIALPMGALFLLGLPPIDAVPDITNVQVQINTRAEAHSPEMVELSITYPIESALGSVPGAKQVRSITRYGLSQVTVIFEEGTDLQRARQLVAERITALDLPENIRPRLGPLSTGLGEIVHYVLSPEEPDKDKEKLLAQMMRLRTLQDWDIKPRLLRVPGVTEVNVIGGYGEKYFVQPDLNRMNRSGIHMDELENALRENNTNAGGGYVRQTAENFLVQGDGLIRDLNEIKQIPIKRLPDFSVVRMGDVAVIQPGRENRTGAGMYNGQEAVLGTVMMLPGKNSREVSQAVRKTIQAIQKNLPDDVELKIVYDRSELVDATSDIVRENLLLGAFFVILILLVLTGNIRAALITSAVIPLSFLGALGLMSYFNVSANLMSLGAMDFGVIIDGAVIVMDACVRRVSEFARQKGRKLTRAEVQEAVAGATTQIRKAAGFGQLVILIVFMPIFALKGIEGKMFHPMAFSFCFALITAFLLAFTAVPALAGLLLSGRPVNDSNRLMRFLERVYGRALSGAYRFRVILLSAGACILAISSVIFSLMGGEFLPRLHEGSLAIQFVRPVNIGVESALKLETISHKLILEFPEVRSVFSRLGTAEIATDPMGINVSDTWVNLKDETKRPLVADLGRPRTDQEVFQAIEEKLKREVPGQRILLSQPIQLRFNELLEGSRADISLKIFGDDMEKLEELSARAREVIEKIPGAGDVETELRGKSPILHITPRNDVLKQLGLSRRELMDTVQGGIGGEAVGYYYRGLRRFPLYIRLSEKDRRDLSSLYNLPVGVAESYTLPMSRLARLEFKDSYPDIKRDSSRRRATVMINLRGRDTESFVDEAMRVVSREIKPPEGYYFEWGGNFKNLQEARRQLTLLGPMALLILLMVIYSASGNLKQTMLVFLPVPFALAGGVINLSLNGLPFSISAGVGFIAVSGIAVLNGILLVNYTARLSQRGYTGFRLIFQSSRLRLRAILMTAVTDTVGFLPMMTASGAGSEVQRPVATVVIGGILMATFGALFVLPLVYNLLDKGAGSEH